jgi:NDP-sugar pyrophosphorylase family protein
MRAIILAGGKGTRLRPYTTLIPKPLVPLGGKYSILEIVIMQLARYGFHHITLAVNHLSHLIMAYFGDGARFGLKLDYSPEERELSTIGPLTLMDDLPENFLVMNGDLICDLDYRAFFETHVQKGNRITVSVYRRDVKIDFGVLRYDQNGRLIEFQEKPTFHFDVSMGIYCFNKSVIDALPRGKPYGFDNLMIDGLARGQVIDVHPHSGYWRDIGRPDDYQEVDEQFAAVAQTLGLSL